jgi:hypothetical protein
MTGYTLIISLIYPRRGFRASPFFINQTLNIATFSTNSDIFNNSDRPPAKIYYILRTIGGNVPSYDSVSRDFLGSGIPLDQYPQFGEIIIE